MKRFGVFICTIAAAMLTAAATQAADNTGSVSPHLDLSHAQQVRAQVQARIGQALTSAQKSGVAAARLGGTKPAELFANPDRAYPPSCLNSPMPLGMWKNDPNALVANVNLIGDPYTGNTNETNYVEADTVYLFRVVCTSGLSATLLEIDRPSADEGNSTLYPTLPAISVQQGNNNFYIRFADDPNTFFSTAYALNPLIDSDVFVLENFYNDARQIDYNAALTLTVDTLNTNDSNRYTPFNLGDYNPAQYASASQPLPISGYMSTNWKNPNQSGEGIVLQVYDNGDNATRTLAFAWFTYDQRGLPFWLYGQSNPFAIGATSVVATTAYFTGGLFAPSAAKPPVSPVYPYWGTATISFPNCDTMNLTFNGNASAVQGPTGSGSIAFQRVADVNSLVCK